MTMPKGSREIAVDGERYRWRVSKGSIVVEHSRASRSVVREVLDRKESVGPGRIARLVRHALARGWQPQSPEHYGVPAPDPFAPPQGRDEYLWRKVLRRTLEWFEACVGVPVELGSYWWESPEEYASGSLGARIRWGQCRVLPDIEQWEGALSIGGNRGERGRASVSGFGFRDGCFVRAQQEQAFLFRAEPRDGSGRFVADDWRWWDGPGEWEYVQRAGDLFGDATVPARGRGSTIDVTLGPELMPAGRCAHAALHAVSNEHGRALVDPHGAPWIHGSGLTLDEGQSLEIDVGALARGWFSAGRHRVALRVGRVVYGEGEQSLVTEPAWVTLER